MGPPADYPAAHSMDTDWFAVDQDGHVAVFDSGEAGAVPEPAGMERATAVFERLRQVRTEPLPLFNLMDWMRLEGTEDEHHIDLGAPPGSIARPTPPVLAEPLTGRLRRVLGSVGRTVRKWSGQRPAQAPNISEPDLTLEALRRILSWSPRSIREQVIRDLGTTLGTVLMFLESADAVREELDRGLAALAPARAGVAVMFPALPHPVAWRLHQAGACLGCFNYMPITWDSVFPRLALSSMLGLFHYEHTCENWISRPYKRGLIPEQPIRAEQLPFDVRLLAERFRFQGLRFADSEQIQPVSHASCESYEVAYLDLDGKTIRPLPGREEEFRDRLEEYDDSQFTIELPPT